MQNDIQKKIKEHCKFSITGKYTRDLRKRENGVSVQKLSGEI